MHTVINAEQGKALMARLPPKFDITPFWKALDLLKECLVFEDVQHCQRLADVQEAWGRVYRSPEAINGAKAVRLHAARRLGELAQEARGNHSGKGLGGGPRRWLTSQGIPEKDADYAAALRKIPAARFAEIVARPTPPTVSALARGYQVPKGKWSRRAANLRWSATFTKLRQNYAKTSAQDAIDARLGVDVIREQAIFMRDWFDTFIASLPKKVRG
jgi:hypothetical protein